jgi:diguanylate cyclase (GGDEF)-like protein/PAS domain S-box-containing protein
MGSPGDRGEAVLRSVAFATDRFRRVQPWLEAVPDVLSSLGGSSGVDRAYLFENVRDGDGRLSMDLRFEWVSQGIRRIFTDPSHHSFAYAPAFRRWVELMARGGSIAGPVSAFPESEQAVLRTEGTLSTLAVPVSVSGEWWGFFGMDDLTSEREWSQIERDGLVAVAGALGSAIERDLGEGRRRDVEHVYAGVIENIPAITYVDEVNENSTTIFISPQVEKVLGYSPAEWLADRDLWPKLLHPDDRSRAIAANTRHNQTGEPFSLEYRMIAKDGSVVWVRDEAVQVRGGRDEPVYSNGVMVDITDRKRAEEQLAFLAYHDELTGLPSRTMFEELLELSMARARRYAGSVAVICLDLDDFSLVNDTLGHVNGDRLLRAVADRLRGATRETDLVARKGSDQFLLLIADLEREAENEVDAAGRAGSVAQRIHESLRHPFEIGGTEVYVSASMGISLFPQDAADATALVRNAEAAMYESKRSGHQGFVVSSGSGDRAERLAFTTKLRKAVESERWTLHYQPIVELATGATVGVEALIRWTQHDGSLVQPNDFIPLAEELGLIETIGDWVVEELVRQATAWRAEGLELEIGFNLSPRQFWQPDLSERILSRIRRGSLDPNRIMVEITESSAMMDPGRAHQILWDLHNGGLRLAIDDFGTGYSSLSRLREVPVQLLKIDRSFVKDVHLDKQAASITTAFIQLARGLGMGTLAEGIETQGELDFLLTHGCQLGQGFLFSHPVPGEEISARYHAGELIFARSA